MPRTSNNPPTSREPHWVKIAYLIAGAAIGMGGGVIKEEFLDTPDYALAAEFCVPISRKEADLVYEENGVQYPLPNTPNPIHARFRNAGRKALQNIEIFLELQGPPNDATKLGQEHYGTKPQRGFGKVDLISDGPVRRIFRIALFNPGDEIDYYAAGPRPATLVAYSKIPGLSFYQSKTPGCS